MRAALIWLALVAACTGPILIAANSSLLQWRQPVYIFASFAGIAALSILLLQPLLVSGRLPGLPARRGRRVHVIVGVALVLCVLFHVGGLWITSPPDMIDALTFAAPTLFSPLGVISMWLVFAAATLALARRRLPLRAWRIGHTLCVALAVLTAVIHAVLIEGTMGTVSKAALCLLALAATAKVIGDRGAWRSFRRPRP